MKKKNVLNCVKNHNNELKTLENDLRGNEIKELKFSIALKII